MKSPLYFIVKPVGGRRYDNVRDFGGIDFIISSSKEDHTASNRFAEVVSTPSRYKGSIKAGDTLLVHHNVFKYYNDMRGRERSSHNFLRDDLFMIDQDQFFMVNDGNVWKTTSYYCFIKPSDKKEYYLDKLGVKEPLIGTIRYITPELVAAGLSEGDEVVYTPGTEYEFNVDGERLYRMNNKNVCILL
jgi:hypothetical protein